MEGVVAEGEKRKYSRLALVSFGLMLIFFVGFFIFASLIAGGSLHLNRI